MCCSDAPIRVMPLGPLTAPASRYFGTACAAYGQQPGYQQTAQGIAAYLVTLSRL